MNASVRDLKSRLSRYLRQVQQGETVVVTLRGKPIARLVPLPPLLLEERLAALPGVNAGTGGKPKGATRPVRVKSGKKSVADIVVEERR